MAPLIAIIAAAAAKVGAPVIKSILSKHVGGLPGTLAGTVIDHVADRIGIDPEKLPEADTRELENAVRDVEAATPELIALYQRGIEGQFALLQAETDKETLWASAWRWGWMYLLGFLWFCALFAFPVSSAFGVVIEPMDKASLLTLTPWFLALYMGGHTIKSLGQQAVEAIKTWRAR